MTTILFAIIVLFAALLQTISGFGFALLAMPLATLAFSVAAPGVMGVRIAAPLVAMTGFTLYAVNLLRYRQALQWHAVTRLALAAACGIPLGIWMVATVNETVVKLILAAVLILYALNSLLRPLLTLAPTSLAQTAGRAGSTFVLAGAGVYLAGFLAGLLGGAYNTPGPPVIIYGTLQGWPRNELRSILQALFLFSSALVIASHLVAGHLTATVWTHYLIGLPALLLGVGLGAQVDRRLDHDRFRQVLNVMILLTGLVLIAQELSRKV